MIRRCALFEDLVAARVFYLEGKVTIRIGPVARTIEPEGAPVVPEVTVAEMDGESSSFGDVELGVTVRTVVVVAGRTRRVEVTEAGVKLLSPA